MVREEICIGMVGVSTRKNKSSMPLNCIMCAPV
jgi:hypothetical protein